MKLEQYIVQYGAPTLAGIKVGSLFSFPFEGNRHSAYREIYSQNRGLLPSGVKIEVLGERQGRLLVYIYRITEFDALLENKDIRAFLRQRGYMTGGSRAAVLKCLRKRIEGSQNFPHEIGVFLGYPLPDVMAFIADGGKNYAYLGYWKAYENPERAKAVCDEYRACTARLMDWFSRGITLGELVAAGSLAG